MIFKNKRKNIKKMIQKWQKFNNYTFFHYKFQDILYNKCYKTRNDQFFHIKHLIDKAFSIYGSIG